MHTRNLLIGALMALAGATGAQAETVTLHTPSNFNVLAVSPNGKWACGVYVDAMSTTYAFRWNLESGSIEKLGATTGIGWDVADDGTVSGEFEDAEALENGAPISLPGYYKDGKWRHLQMPEGRVRDGVGGGISTNGEYVSGSICVDGIYTPIIWKNGVIDRVLESGRHCVPFAIAPDGSGAAGYATQYNRTSCYWPASGETIFFMDSPDYSQTPWSYSRNFSPDGTKIVYWGGWEVEGETLWLYCVYDIALGETQRVEAPSMDSDLEFFDISNNGLLVGANGGRGYVCTGDNGYYIDDYLAMRGVDLTTFEDFYMGTDYYVDQLPVFRVIALSEDENVFAMLYYNTLGELASLIVKLDQDMTAPRPVEVSARCLDGLQTAAIEWKAPVGARNIRGYNIYRDGVKINGFMPVSSFAYYDRNLAPGTYNYEVSAVTVAGVETKAESLQLTVAEPAHSAPYALQGRRKGVNRANIVWNAPMTDITHKRYYDRELTDVTGFSIYEALDVEFAIRFSKAEMANYSGNTIREVSFMPLGNHDFKAVNLYTYAADGSLSLIGTQEIGAIELNTLNTITFDEEVEIPQGDLIVAIEVSTNPDEEYLAGTDAVNMTAQFSDLLRLKTDADFFSTYDSSTASSLYLSCISWIIDLGLAPAEEQPSDLSWYNVYLDGVKVGEAEENVFVTDPIEDGSHLAEVEAVYADGSVSERVPVAFDMQAAFVAVDKAEVDPGEDGSTAVTITWENPVDCDLTPITYTKEAVHANGLRGYQDNGYALMAANIYPATMLRGYEGYEVRTFRFYPLADAIFTLMLYAGDELVYEQEVEEFTIGSWNDIALDCPVEIEPNKDYTLILDCFDPEPGVKLVAIDDQQARAYFSDLYSTDNGETWGSFSLETGANGNWMLSMTIADGEGEELDVDGYDVEIDGVVRNGSTLKETEFTYDFGKGDRKEHLLRVNVYYPARTESVQGGANYFYLAQSGISDTMIGTITLRRGENYLVAEGEGVQGMVLVSTSGMTVASAQGNSVDISALADGVYIVRVQTAAGSFTRKIAVSRNIQ